MTKIYSKVTVLVLAFAMIISSFSFAAVSFTDTEGHWSSDTVEKISSKNIMPGFSDATFRPDAKISKLEAMVTIYRIMKMSGKISSDYEVNLVAKHKSTLESLAIPAMLSPYGTDTYVACAFALENNIVEQDELKYFVVDGKLTEAKKIDVSVFLGKAINVYKKENLDKFIAFSFRDTADITYVAAPYVYSLVEKNIISSKGDVNGNFNAKNPVTRAVMATMALGAYDYVVGGVDSSSLTTNTSTSSNTEITVTNGTTINTSTSTTSEQLPSYTGKISVIHLDKNLIEVRDSLNRLKVYETTNVPVYINGNIDSASNLKIGQNAKFSFSASKLNKIEVEKTYSVVSGYIDQISIVGEGTAGKYTVVSVKTSTGKMEYFKTFASTYVSLNGLQSSLDKLSINDKVEVNYEGYEAKRIEGFGKVYVIGGSSNTTVDLKVGSNLSLKLNDGSTFNQTITDQIVLSSSSNMIKTGDIVKVTLEYGLVKKVENTGMTASDTGKIVEILISESPKLTILNSENVKKTYAIKKGALMYSQDGTVLSGVYDLRLDSNVNLTLDVDGITKITASKEVDKVKFEGKITEIFKASNIFKIKNEDNSKSYIVSFKSGSKVSIDSYNVGDAVYIVGVELSSELFEAELVINAN